MRAVALFGLLILVTQFSVAQETKGDTIISKTQTDTATLTSQRVEQIESYASRFDPRKALLLSAIMPGAGQLYNKKYWKMPLVYGGFAVTTVVVVFWDNSNRKYRNELFGVLNDGGTGLSPSGLNADQLRRAIDISRRQRDFFILMSGVWYILQMVDAHVDAHLKEFQLNPKLQVKWEPHLENNVMLGRQAGFTLSVRF
ncbi:MAG TPA: DUF5683 domain-containing protein [Cyclobacteriaceae bacterium]|nr:DUF5683 domain-containing protein [Cyclobacteriaceae bacterium]HRF34185.1 DUF5683 domain-containing protein [Cyclobacteriaceae bacterium]